METQNGAVERQLFNNVDSTRDNRPPNEPVDSMYTTDFKVSRLNGASGNTIGIAKSLYVNQGDQVSIETKYFFDDFQYNNSNVSIADLATALASTFVFNSPDMTNLSSEVKNSIAATEFTGNVDLTNFLSNAFGSNLVNDPSKPQAFLVYLFYDLNYQFIPEASGILQVEDPNVLGTLAMLNLTIPKNGFFYMYTNNESNKTVNFNNTGLIHLTGALLEENHYYPFGKLIADLSGRIQHTSPKNNNYKYNGKELITDLSFDVEDYGARYYDATIGRWLQVDPLAEKYFSVSGYEFSVNNPILFIDPNGMDVINGHKQARDDAEAKKNNASCALEGVSKDDENYKTLKREFRQANRQFKKIDRMYNQVEKSINEVKKDDPKYFDLINKMQTPDGKKINVYVTATETYNVVPGTSIIGQTTAKYKDVDYNPQSNFRSPSTAEHGANSITIAIGAFTGGKTLKHEFGHAEILGLHGNDYLNYLSANPNQNDDDTVNSNNPSSIRALQAEYSYDGNPNTSLIK